MTIIADVHPFVVGVDTHARYHALAVVAAPTGKLIASEQFRTTRGGMASAIAWVARATGGDADVLWAIEGVATYGAGLARAVTAHGYRVLEAPAMNARANRGVGKSDPLDAERIAVASLRLSASQQRHPRADDGPRAALRILVAARDHISGQRTAAVNALNALARAFDLDIDARHRLSTTKIRQIASWRTHAEDPNVDLAVAIARAEAVRLATLIGDLDAQLKTNQITMNAVVKQSATATLLDQTGIGPVTAAIVMTAWSHPGRVRSEAAFAKLAGVNPIPASSGNTTRHRLNRGGDRRLNRALHMTIVTRIRTDPQTKAYVERRIAEGRTKREICRSLKRYLARQIYRTLNTTNTTPAPA
jgi:transposase